jgi:Ca2+-dependent lipid-binding protein
VLTEQDNGPDQYDLPPPSKEGALASPTTDASGGDGLNHIHATEKASYEERVGWAPRFGLNTMTQEEQDESLLDHTTFLEGKIDDKFFGDWYHNTGVIIFACLSSWIVAVLGGGLGWLFLVMALCGTYYRTSIRRVRRNVRDDLTREMAKARLETDNESLEWMNSFLLKFWPIYAPLLCETIISSVDQVLSTSTPAFLDSLRMKFFTLGTKPPRLDHVKTYPKAEDDIVLMDWKFSFTPVDRNDLTARQLKEKIPPKIVLEVRLGKGVISKGLDVIVEDFAFSGLMRVKVKLQLPFPHIQKVEICFLDKPEIDYVCKPLGGDALGFDINVIPGLEGFIKDMIHSNLAPIMYEPNVFPIEIAKMLSGSAVDQAIGIIAVTLHGAQGLRNPDKLAGNVDPYVLVSLNSTTPLGKTKIVKENANPRWNETIYIIVTSLTDTLTLQAFDWNEYRKDKELGTASFALDQLEQITEHENQHLTVKANNKDRGVIQADIRFFPVLEGLKLEDGTEQPPPESNTGIAKFTVEQAQDLDGSKSMVGALNPYAVLLLNGTEIHVSKKLKRTNKPIWPDGFKEFLVTDRKAARLGVVIKDERDLGTDPIIGTYQIKLDDMMKMEEQGKEWYNLSGAQKGRVKLMLQWKPVGLKGIEGGSGGYITPIGVMRVHFQNARNLRNVETMGKSDPYARVLLSGIQKGKTVTWENHLNPDWDEVIYVPVHSPRERLTLEVMDYQSIGKDRSLGLVELAAADYIHEGDSGEYLVHDKKQLSEGLRLNGRGQAKGVLNFTAAFYPTIATADPEEEEEERRLVEESTKPGHSRAGSQATARSRADSKASTRKSVDAVAAQNEKERVAGRIDTSLKKQLSEAQREQESGTVQEIPKLRLTANDLTKYESGLLIFKLISGDFAKSNVYLEVLMDDQVFPSYASSRTRSRHTEFGETGDAVVRELDLSRITLRLVEKQDKKGEGEEEHLEAKLQGDTLQVLQKCLVSTT